MSGAAGNRGPDPPPIRTHLPCSSWNELARANFVADWF
jgi:hypothetical protein